MQRTRYVSKKSGREGIFSMSSKACAQSFAILELQFVLLMTLAEFQYR